MSDELKDRFSSARLSRLRARLRKALRGEVTLATAALEAARRAHTIISRSRERALINKSGGALAPPRLAPKFARLNPRQLLEHFRTRTTPRFLHGLEEAASASFREIFAARFASERATLLREADEIIERGRFPLMGFGVVEFGREPDWLRDPLTGARWPLSYHCDVRLTREDGDVRVLWELNRLGHLVTLARAFAVTDDERYAVEMVRRARHWREMNPLGRGPNWACAMEVALRAVNLSASLALIRRSTSLDEESLTFFLSTLDEHGAHISRNLEFSHIRTSNHYLSDVAGLFWLGVLLPELDGAHRRRETGLREMLGEMEKQVLGDGAHAEASTGYHRFIAELFLSSFLLARENGIEIEEKYRRRLRAMLDYARSYLRPDGRAPLVGDADGGRFLDLTRRAADEHAYLIDVGAVALDDAGLKTGDRAPQEILWLLGTEALRRFDAFADTPPRSRAFRDAGTYVLRDSELYLLLNGCGAGLRGRGSHGHNDKLSIEVSAYGASLLRDPGTYVYTGDLRERHLFRSTAYHSTVEVDGVEQATTDERAPFIIGDESHPRLVNYRSDDERDMVALEHDGYARLATGPVRHRRTVLFDKRARLWLVEDALTGEGRHTFRFRFHFAPGVEVAPSDDGSITGCDRINGACLVIIPFETAEGASFMVEPRWSSVDYGAKDASRAACWTIDAGIDSSAPLVVRWALVPLRARGRIETVGAFGGLGRPFRTRVC